MNSAVHQYSFSIFERDAEKDILTYGKSHGLASLGCSSICGGLLSGKMTKDRQFKDDELHKGMDPKFNCFHYPLELR